MVTEDNSTPAPLSTPRRKVVQTHFTQDEYDKLKDYCHENRYSMSQYVRISVMGSLSEKEDEAAQ